MGSPMSVPELWILRHGQTEWNVTGRLQGHLDSPLTETGHAQAAAQGRILARLLPQDVAVISSPSPRALSTGQIALPGRAIAQDPRLKEIDLGQWQGRTLAGILATYPEIAADPDPNLWKFHAPGGESLPAMEARLRGVLADLTGPTVLVTHGVTSRLMRCLILGLPVTAMSDVPGGQGVVHHLRDGVARVLA
jgi:broad specificity phosphatase PhoE